MHPESRIAFRWLKAARGMESLDEQVTQARMYRSKERKRYQALSDALTAWEAQPLAWKAYKAVYDRMWALGHPGTRWGIRLFQKMTPEKREKVTSQAMATISHYRERIEGSLGWGETILPRLRKDQDRLRAFVKSGVAAPPEGEEVTKQFDVKLSGWRYGEHLKEEVEARATEMFRGPGGEDLRARNPEFFEEMVESSRSYWNTIKVVLPTGMMPAG